MKRTGSLAAVGRGRTIVVAGCVAACGTQAIGPVRTTPTRVSGDPFPGSDAGVVTLAAGQAYPLAIAVDRTSVYWANSGRGSPPQSGSIMKADLDGNHVATLASGQHNPVAITIDATSVYWVTSGTVANPTIGGTVMKLPLGGGAPTTLASAKGPTGIAVDSSGVYFADQAGGTVLRVPIGGGSPVTLASGQDGPTGVAVDATSIYWMNYAPSVGGAIAKVALAGVRRSRSRPR